MNKQTLLKLEPVMQQPGATFGCKTVDISPFKESDIDYIIHCSPNGEFKDTLEMLAVLKDGRYAFMSIGASNYCLVDDNIYHMLHYGLTKAFREECESIFTSNGKVEMLSFPRKTLTKLVPV